VGLKLGISPNGQIFRVLGDIPLDEEVRGYSFSLLCSYWLQKINYGQNMTQCAQKCSSRMTNKPNDILILRRIAYISLNCLSVILQEGWICAGAIHEITCGSEHRSFGTRMSRVVALTRRAAALSLRIYSWFLSKGSGRLGESQSTSGRLGKIKVSGIKRQFHYFLCYPYLRTYTKNKYPENRHVYIGFIYSETFRLNRFLVYKIRIIQC